VTLTDLWTRRAVCQR